MAGGLPDTLKEGFKQLNRLQGQYRVTSVLIEDVDLEDLRTRIGPTCGFCNVKEETEKMKTFVEEYKPTTTIRKVKVGSALYEEGIRWIQYSGRTALNVMVIGHKNYIKNGQPKKDFAQKRNSLSMDELIIPGSNLFRVCYMDDGGKLREDTSFSWRRAGEEVARPGIYRKMWKLDEEGNLESTHEGLLYCAHCKDVKKIVETHLAKRV